MNRLLNDFLPDASAPADITATPGTDIASAFMMVTAGDVSRLLRPRAEFSHKGDYGHLLIVAGAPQTMGAALLTAMGSVYAGAGLTTVAIPEQGLNALNVTLPEAMYADRKDLVGPAALDTYSAIALGPGLQLTGKVSGTDLNLLERVMSQQVPLVIDAEGLNYLSVSRPALNELRVGTVLTPHVKEFDRLFGVHDNWWGRLQTAIKYAKKQKVVVVLKNRYTFIVEQSGQVYINTSGGPAMSQGGMGDVLTGVIAALVAQGYAPNEAAITGCYLHGMAGGELAEQHFNVTASQVAAQLPKSRLRLQMLTSS
ncbi:NAD(P)H-hydrate dehydratase [Pedobacter faecalis]|uniref:NAD(P)H-hydrate dehydratase n=1 Tax=Pedobacter faecalis TaxID=3041495 RepID=UPI00254EC93F|nr:NAD(P)H-hydrate dehydratase [Pedobacter sp. ELA7]